jgi:hypothetical protein
VAAHQLATFVVIFRTDGGSQKFSKLCSANGRRTHSGNIYVRHHKFGEAVCL